MNSSLKLRLSSILLICFTCACYDNQKRNGVEAQVSPNGIMFQHFEIREQGIDNVSISISWPTDWPHTVERNPAVAYIGSEVVLLGGTSTYSPREVIELFDESKAKVELHPYPDHVIGKISFTNQNQEEVIETIAELIANPQFPDDWVERIRGTYLNNSEERNIRSAFRMWSVARYAVLGDTPLRAFLDVGSTSDIEQVDKPLLVEWHKDTFMRSGINVSIVGAIDVENAGRVIDQLLAGLPAGIEKEANYTPSDFSARTILLHIPEANKTTIGLIGNLPNTTDGQDIADVLVMNYLGGNGTGPLFEAIRTKLRAAYGIGAGLANFDRNSRFFFINGEVEEARLSAVHDEILDTYEEFRTTGNFIEFEDQREELGTFLKKEMGYYDVASFTMLQAALDGLDPDIIPNLGEHVLGFKLDMVRARLLEKFPNSDQLLVVVTSPNARALPDACVIRVVTEAADC